MLRFPPTGHAAAWLAKPRSRSRLEDWKPKNWALNTLSCDTLHVRRTSTHAEDRWVSATAETIRMRAEPWQTALSNDWEETDAHTTGVFRWLGAWMQQCPFAREPVVCCGTSMAHHGPCWRTVCSPEETANYEVMRGFALAATNVSEIWR